MTNTPIILSYHVFGDQPSDYKFSRTFSQFAHDIDKKIYDQIHIDDARICTIKACDMLRNSNRRAKVFVCTELVGRDGFCSWDDLRALSRFHDIENHGSIHKDHALMSYGKQFKSIGIAMGVIEKMIGRKPRYFVPPYNQYNADTVKACSDIGITLVHGRINVTNYYK